MHPAIEGPGLATQKPLRDLAEALINAGQTAWYAAFKAKAGQFVVVHVAVGEEAEKLDAFINDRRRLHDDPNDQVLLYRGDALHESQPPGAKTP